MPKYITTNDNITHELPDNATDEDIKKWEQYYNNVEPIKFSKDSITLPQSQSQTQPQTQPQIEPQTQFGITDLLESDDVSAGDKLAALSALGVGDFSPMPGLNTSAITQGLENIKYVATDLIPSIYKRATQGPQRKFTEEEKEASPSFFGEETGVTDTITESGAQKFFGEIAFQKEKIRNEELIVKIKKELQEINNKVNKTKEDRERIDYLQQIIYGRKYDGVDISTITPYTLGNKTDKDTKIDLERISKIGEEEYRNREYGGITDGGLYGTYPMDFIYDGKRIPPFGLLRSQEIANEEIASAISKQQNVKTSETFKAFAEAESTEEAVDILLSDFTGIVKQTVASSLVPMGISLSAGVGTSMLTRSYTAGSIATGIASGSVDTVYSATEFLRKNGVDINDEKAVVAFLNEDDNRKRLRQYVIKRGVFIGAFDAAAFKLAPKVIAPSRGTIFAKDTIKDNASRHLINSLVQAPLQGTLGGAGEYFAQLSTLEEGEQIRIGDVALEVVGEFGFSVVEVPVAQLTSAYTTNKSKRQKELYEDRIRAVKDYRDKLNGLPVEDPYRKEIEAKIKKEFQRIQQLNPDANPAQISIEAQRLVFEQEENFKNYTGFTPAVLEADQILQDNNFNIVRIIEKNSGVESNNYFKSRFDKQGNILPDENGDFVITDLNENEVARYKDQQYAVDVLTELQKRSNMIAEIQWSQEKAIEQNVDADNNLILDFVDNINNSYLLDIHIDDLKTLNISEETLTEIKEIQKFNPLVNANTLKEFLTPTEFNKVLKYQTEQNNFSEVKQKSFSKKTFNSLLKDLNIIDTVDSNAFKYIANRLVAETDINKMGLPQKRLLYSFFNRLPKANTETKLLDLSATAYNINDYSIALEGLEKIDVGKKVSIKNIQDSTGLNKKAAENLRQTFVTAGYLDNDFKFTGTSNRKYNFDGSLRPLVETSLNEAIETVQQEIIKLSDKLNLPETKLKFTTFLDRVKNRDNINFSQADGVFDRAANEILLSLDKADLNVLSEKNGAKKFLQNISQTLGHESWHALRQADLFTAQEINALENFAKTKIRKDGKTYYEEALDRYEGKPGYTSEFDFVDEAIAFMFEDYINNPKKITGRPRNALQKTSNFFKGLANAVFKTKYKSAGDILEAAVTGEIAARPRGTIRTTQELQQLQQSTPLNIKPKPPVSDEPSLAFSLTEQQIENKLEEQIGNTRPFETDRKFREWSPVIDTNIQNIVLDVYKRQVNNATNPLIKLDGFQKTLTNIIKDKNNKLRETSNFNDINYNNLDFKIAKSSQLLFATTQEYLQANNITPNSKATFAEYKFRKLSDSDYYVGFAIGETDVAKGMDTLTVYNNINDASKRIESPFITQQKYQKYIGNNVGPNKQNEYDQYITPVLFKPQAILLNPLLLGSNFIFSQKPEYITGDGSSITQKLNNIFGDNELSERHKTLVLENTNNPNLLVKSNDNKRTVSTSFVEDPPELGNLKYSLRETNGRLIDDVKATLEEQSGAPTLEGYFRNLYGTVASIPPPIKEFLKDGRGEGSEYIAPLMTLGAKAFVKQLTGNRKNQGLFHYGFGFPNLSVVQAQEISDGIDFVTQESIKLFPEEIVVYRGSRIDDSYQLIPTTTNKFIAESFGQNLLRRNERIEELYYKRKQDGTIEPNVTLEEFGRQLLRAEGRPEDIAKYGYNVKKYLLPKEAIAVNMNALYRGESMLGDANNLYADRYNYIREQELLIPTNFLIDDYGDTTGKQVLTTHLQDVNKIQRDRIIIQGDTQTITSGNFNVPQEQIKTLTRQELLDAKADLILLANEPQYQNDNINADDMYALVNHPAMLAMQNEALAIPDVYDNLTEAQRNKRMNEMIPELTDIATEYAKGNLKYDKKAIIIIGPPATGKSTFAENIAARKGYAIVDADDAKKQMPEYKNGIGANATHKFSKYIAAEIQKQFIEEGANIIIPKVAGKTNNRRQPDISKIKYIMQDLQSRGYKVDIVYPDANINQAIVRAITRFGETGRFVSVDYLVSIDNKVKDSYNALKDYVKRTATPNVGFTYINNTKKLGEEIVEEDTAQLFQDDRIVDRNRSRSRRGSSEEQPELSEQDKENIQTAKEQEQNSIAAGLIPVINTNASPSAVSAAIEAQKEIKNSTSETNADVDSIINDIPNDIKLKYSFNKNKNPLNQNAEELIENLTVRDDTIESKTIGQLVLEGFKPIDATKEFGMKVREQIADRYGRLALTDVKAGKKNKYGDQMLLASMSAGAALYFSDRSGDIFMQSFIRGFPRYDKDKGYTYVTDISQIDGKPVLPFADIFAPAYKNPNLLWAFQAVQRVKRETRFNKEGRKVKVTAADRKKAKQVLQDYPEVQTMIDEYNRTNEHTVQFLVDTGVLDAKTAETWLANSDYIPFYRPLEGMEGFKGPKIFQGLSITPFQKAKGSETKDIVDPITGITNNLRAAINLGMKNVAANRVMRNLIDLEVAKQVKGNVKGPDVITIRVKGKNTNFKIDDPMLYYSMNVMSEADYAPMNLLMNIARGTKRFVSDLITRAPAFWIAQILRDSLSAYTLSGANYIPVISSVAETFRIAKGMITGRLPEEFVKLKNAGIITGYDKGIREIDSTQSLIDGYYKNAFKSERPTAEKIYMFPIDLVTGLWDILGQGTAITDAATRVAVYKDTLKRTGNEAEAIYQALEVLNFTRRGNNKAFQTYQQMTMFLNPRLQGLDVFYRGLTGRYGIGRGLSPSKRTKSVWLRLATIMAMMPGYYFLVRDSEEYEEAPDEIKDNYLIIPGSKKITGGFPLVIPKPFEVGLISMTVPERLTSYFADDVAGEDVAKRIKKMTRHTFSLTLPTAVDPLVENFANYDLFTGRQIVPDYLKGTDDAGYRPQTDTLSKVIGDELNISPLYVENLVRGYTGTLGSYLMIATDSVLREGLTDAERVKFGVDQLPVIGRFLLPKEGSNYENQFYNLKKDVDDTINTFRVIEDNIEKRDKFAKGLTDEYKIEYMRDLKRLQKELQKVADELKEFRTAEASIINSSTLSSEEKRIRLDSIAEQKNDYLRAEQIMRRRKEYLQGLGDKAVVR